MPSGPGHVVLVGLMGSGKSTVGRRLARRLERRFVDADDEVEAVTGRSVADIFSEDGELGFRAVETTVLGELLASGEPTVVAAGGGAVVTEANRALLSDRRVTVVWLDASAGFLASRAAPKPHRPLLSAGDAREVLARLHRERAALYRDVADIVVDVEPFHRSGGRSKSRLADHVAELVRSRESAGAESTTP